PRTEGGDPRAGAVATEAPTHAEEGRAGDQLRLEVAPRGEVEALAEEGRLPARDEPVRDEVHQHGAEHHEGEARVPIPGHVEEADDLGGLRHPRDGEAHAEEEARAEPDHGFLNSLLRHEAPPSTWWTMNTVAMPVVMNVAVATIERIESRP